MRKSTYKLGQQKQSRKTSIVLLVLVLFITLLTGVFLVSRHGYNTVQKQGTASSEVAEGESKDTRDVDGSEKKPIAYEGDDVNNTDSLSGVITHSSVANDSLVIRNVINQYIESGKCRLTLTQGSKTVVEEVDILQDPSSSTCQGFDILISRLGAGQWNIVIEITDDDGRSGKITGEVNI